MTCDAFPFGIWDMLAHRGGDGDERPIVFASRLLTLVVQKYSRPRKEQFVFIHGVERFSQFL